MQALGSQPSSRLQRHACSQALAGSESRTRQRQLVDWRTRSPALLLASAARPAASKPDGSPPRAWSVGQGLPSAPPGRSFAPGAARHQKLARRRHPILTRPRPAGSGRLAVHDAQGGTRAPISGGSGADADSGSRWATLGRRPTPPDHSPRGLAAGPPSAPRSPARTPALPLEAMACLPPGRIPGQG